MSAGGPSESSETDENDEKDSATVAVGVRPHGPGLSAAPVKTYLCNILHSC